MYNFRRTYFSDFTIDKLREEVQETLRERMDFLRLVKNKGKLTSSTFKISMPGYGFLSPKISGKYQEWRNGTKIDISIKLGIFSSLFAVFSGGFILIILLDILAEANTNGRSLQSTFLGVSIGLFFLGFIFFYYYFLPFRNIKRRIETNLRLEQEE